MNLQPRIACLALAIASTMVACSDDNPPVITGENTLVGNASFPILDNNGTDLTAVNQDNFPLPTELAPGAASGEESGPALGTGSSGDESVTDGADPELGAAIEDITDTTTNFFQLDTAIPDADSLGVTLAALLDSIGSLVIGEYELATGDVVFSDDTVNIAKRIAAGCDFGELESSLNLNGTTITNGRIEFIECTRSGNQLDGVISLETESTPVCDMLNVDFERVIARLDSGEVTLTGLVVLQFNGDEVTLVSDSLNWFTSDALLRWEGAELTGRITEDGQRSLSGFATLVDDLANSDMLFTFAEVSVPGAVNFPATGSQSQVHSDGSMLEIFYGQSGAGTFDYTVTQSDGSSASFRGDIGEVQTRVPFE